MVLFSGTGPVFKGRPLFYVKWVSFSATSALGLDRTLGDSSVVSYAVSRVELLTMVRYR
jgi:hypothetical protein